MIPEASSSGGSEFLYPVPAGLQVVDQFSSKQGLIAKVRCRCCRKGTPVTPENVAEAAVVCLYCRRVCGSGEHVQCVDCCVGGS